MTVLSIATGEAVDGLSQDEARRLTEKIRSLGESIADAIEKVAALIDQASVGSAWSALGYKSWTDYTQTEFGGVLVGLERDVRQLFVRELHSKGMPVRAIGSVVGIGKSQIGRDLQQVSPDGTTDDDDGPALPPWTPVAVTGTDGKNYPSVKPPRRRRPLTEATRYAGWDLHKMVVKIKRLTQDDRAKANAVEIDRNLRVHLQNTIRDCQELLEQIDGWSS